MLPIAGETAGPIGLNFFWGHGGREMLWAIKIRFFRIFLTFVFARATPGPSASIS